MPVDFRDYKGVSCAHLKEAAANIKGIYSKLLANDPDWLLDGEKPKFKPFERMANTSVIAGRECRVTIGSAESQESVRGIDAAMAHLSEVAFWRNSRMKSPEQVMRSWLWKARRTGRGLIFTKSANEPNGERATNSSLSSRGSK